MKNAIVAAGLVLAVVEAGERRPLARFADRVVAPTRPGRFSPGVTGGRGGTFKSVTPVSGPPDDRAIRVHAKPR